MKLLQLPRAKVQIGTALPWNVRDEHCVLLLSKGHIVEDAHLLEALLARGAYVDEEEVRAAAAAAAAAKLLVSGGDPRHGIETPISVFGLWDQTVDGLKLLLSDMAAGSDFAARMDAFASSIFSLVDLSPDIAIYRAVRQENAQHFYYGYTHALHTAVLCILIAQHLEWPAPAMTSLVKAALTMNMTVFELQGHMASQDHPPRDKQRAALLLHPAEAVELLEKAGIIDADWLAAVAQHHERADGTGYPTGRTDICEPATVLHVADIFMAKISPRILRAAISPKDALSQLYKYDKGGPLSTALIKEFGIYPPGDFVKLASGELGVVVQRTANARAPIVASITDTSAHPVAKTVRHDTAQAAFAIVDTVSDKSVLKRLAPERLYGYATAPHA